MDIIFYHRDVRDFIDSLDDTTSARAYKVIRLLRVYGYRLGLPQSRSLGHGLFELRERGFQEVRIFYTFFEGKAMLLSGFVKKTQKTPVQEIQKARSRMKGLTGT